MNSIFKIFAIAFVVVAISSCEDILEVPDISNEIVELLAPKDSTTVASNNVNFNWSAVLEADSYSVQVATPNFENATQIVFDSIMKVDSTFIKTGMTKDLSNGKYEWRVKALNSNYETEYTSSMFNVESSN